MRKVDELLDRFDHSPFSDKAFRLLREVIAEFIALLVLESIQIMEEEELDGISKRLVIEARLRLRFRPRRRSSEYLKALGGIPLGASVATALQMAITQQYPTIVVLASVFLGIAGASMVTWSIPRK
jgi:hypothetical protein